MRAKLKTFMILTIGLLLVVGWAVQSRASATVPIENELISKDSSGTMANNVSGPPSISGDGRYVTFMSNATNLVSGDTNGTYDVFVHDRQTDTTIRASVDSSGNESNGTSSYPRISYDGRYVVFESLASNLVTGDTSNTGDIFIHDMQTGSTRLVSSSPDGTFANNISVSPDVSADGRYVVFLSYASNIVSGKNPYGLGMQVFMKDMNTGATQALSVNGSGVLGNHPSSNPHISCDGGTVSFDSSASNLVPSDTNGYEDVFVDSLGWSGNNLTDVTLLGNDVSMNSALSCNGNAITYATMATNIGSITSNGSQLVYKYNRLTNNNSLVSVATNGDLPANNGQPTNNMFVTVSDDGRYISFQSDATNLDSLSGNHGDLGPNIYVTDTKNQTLQLISRNATYAVGRSTVPMISSDGSYIAYVANISQLESSGPLVSGIYGNGMVYTSRTGF